MRQEGQHASLGRSLFAVSLVVCAFLFSAVQGFADSPKAEKEWTLLVFLNGNNSLDSFGEINMKQMEKVGSTDSVNVVVQWASESVKETKRILVQKSTDADKVTSPIVETLGRVDMGDYKQLVEFAKWGIEHYPAKHYFIDVWNHGNGWHRRPTTVRDISYDDISGHRITTPQLGQAISEVSQVIGRKVDIVGADACLMAMVEVGSEIAPSADFLLGSQEVEPGAGWPYDTFLQHWTERNSASPKDVANILVKDYVDFYDSQQTDVTFSAIDLSQQTRIETSISQLAGAFKAVPETSQKKLISAVDKGLHFTNRDYSDLGDLVAQLRKAGESLVSESVLADVDSSLKSYVIDNHSTSQYQKATGVSIWWPDRASTFHEYSDYYGKLKFTASGWIEALVKLFP